MDPVAPSPPGDVDWSILAGGRSSSALGEAFNRYELRHTGLVALGGVTLADLPADLTVLPVPDDDLVELTEYTSTADAAGVTFTAVWFDRPNGVAVTCPPAPTDPPKGAVRPGPPIAVSR